MKRITIAIDGHSSCGKSTMAKQLAKDLGYIYVDTGAMYRAVTLYSMQHGYISDNRSIDEDRLHKALQSIDIAFVFRDEYKRPVVHLNGKCVEEEIRSIEVSRNVSLIAALPFVRTAMVEKQREMGKAKGVVMDGRDIGTTVFPDAELKIFVTASAEVRAQRRYDELVERSMPADYDEILANVKERDYIDSHREVSPLRMADDAVLLDNSNMTRDEQQQWLMHKVDEILKK
ncbi:MAG: (d)CMP kinase [Bacteroidales bacterium]|nr:(d)CMP kinase [Bacteroidales bacterium]